MVGGLGASEVWGWALWHQVQAIFVVLQTTTWTAWTVSGGRTSPSSPTRPAAQPEGCRAGLRSPKPHVDDLHLTVSLPSHAPGRSCASLQGRDGPAVGGACLPARSRGRLSCGSS